MIASRVPVGTFLRTLLLSALWDGSFAPALRGGGFVLVSVQVGLLRRVLHRARKESLGPL